MKADKFTQVRKLALIQKESLAVEMRTVHDPFIGQDVQISDRLVDRLRGKYASGPHLPNGNPEFGWRQFQAPPIQHEAAARIEALEAALREARSMLRACGLDEPDEEYQASWDRGLAKIDAAIANATP